MGKGLYAVRCRGLIQRNGTESIPYIRIVRKATNRVSINHSIPVSLRYGASGRFSCELDHERVVVFHDPAESRIDFSTALREALEQPLDFPPLEQTVVPDDRIVLAIDRNTPHAAGIVAEIWRIIERRSVSPSDVTIIQPASFHIGQKLEDPRSKLPNGVRQEVTWQVHDPTDKRQCNYLASTSTGGRIYLAKSVVAADLVLPIETIAFDPVLGYRGNGSVIFPWLSTTDAIAKAHGQGHAELTPDNERPLRQMIDEIAWLLGIQLTIQMIAGTNGKVSHILGGMSDSVFKRGKQLLNEEWRVELSSRPEIVVAAIDSGSNGHGWQQLGAALSAARNLVAADGKIVVLSGLNEPLGDGMKIVQAVESPRDAMKPLRLEPPADLIPASQFATAADWAKVYLLSELESDVVEDLFAIPLENEQEVGRLLQSGESCAILASAQHTYGCVSDD